MEKKKILFLDCDGVLNYTQWYIDKRARCKEPILDADIDPACVRRITQISFCQVIGEYHGQGLETGFKELDSLRD